MPTDFYPVQPYRGLAQYRAEESCLFTGREFHVDACAEIIAQVQTRILLLHGQTGCGKSSFLRAGLIPALETRGFGYLFLRKYDTSTDNIGRPVFIRCGPDPLGRIAEELYRYTSSPVILTTAVGIRHFDISSARLDVASVDEFLKHCEEPEFILASFMKISEIIPSTLVIVLDQVEEVLTLSAVDSPIRSRFFKFLKLFNVSHSAAKMVLSLRKDHSGEFIGLAQLDNNIQADFKVYLLPELKRTEVLSAVVLPTSEVDSDGLGSPYIYYRFKYGVGVAESIVDDLFTAIPSGAILPVMQIVCQGLYDDLPKLPGPPEWRVIDDHQYDRGSLTGCVIQHVSNSLRASLCSLDISEAKLEEEERRWRNVLYSLVRHEGDGRVHTDVVSKSGFRERAFDQKVFADVDAVYDHLIQPNVLILRRLVIPTIGREFDEPMCSLGHDVVGLALSEMKIRDQIFENIERNRRQRLNRVLVAIAGVIGLLLIGGYAFFREQYVVQDTAVNDLFHGVLSVYRDDGRAALLFGSRAVLTADSFNPLSLGIARNAKMKLATMLNVLPDSVVNLPIDTGASVQDYVAKSLLMTPPGFLVASPTNGVTVWRAAEINATLGSLSNNQKQNSYFFNRSFVTTSEPFENTVLVMLSSLEPQNEDLKSRILVLRNGRASPPFSAGELLDTFALLVGRRGNMAAASLSHAGLQVSLVGDVILLITGDDDKKTVRTLVVNSDYSDSNPFSLGTEFTTDAPPKTLKPVDNTLIAQPPTQFPIGRQWLFAEFTPMPVQQCSAPISLIESVKAIPLRLPKSEGDQIRGDISSPVWNKRASDIESVRNCLKAKGSSCTVEFLRNPVSSNLIVLGLSARDGSSRFQQYREAPYTSYVIIDSDSGNYKEIDQHQLSKASQTCAAAVESSVSAVEKQDEIAIPSFVDGTLDDVMFGYASRSAIKTIRIKPSKTECTEHLFVSDEVTQWRFSPKYDMLLGLTNQQFLSWNLAKPSEVTKLLSMPASQLLARACMATQIGRLSTNTPTQRSARAAEICN
jgi:hypothetical protein